MTIFIQPGLLKTILAFALFIVSSYLWRIYLISTISDTFPWGFPVQFYLAWGPCPRGESCSVFKGLWLVIDILIWYVVSAFVIYGFKKKNLTTEKELAQ